MTLHMDLPVDRLGGAGNTTGRGWASDFGLLDSRIRLLLVGFASFGLTMAWFALRDLGLPYDRIYQATLFLMWPRGGLGDGPVRLSLLSLDLLCPLLALVLLSAVLLPRSIIGRPPAVLRLAYRYALVLPVFAFVTTTLARLVSNGIYALAGRVTWDGTAAIARFETPLIEALQGGVAGGLLSHVCAAIYAGGWMLSLLAVPVVLMALGRHEGVAQIAVGWMLAALIAAPMFVLIPVFEPWVLNPVYGATGGVTTAVQFLAADAAGAELREIVAQLRWASGACLPSLHVALPALVSAICFRQKVPALGWFFAGLAGAVGFSVVYLGRHWIVDVVAGVAFAIVVAHLCVRLRPERVLFFPGALDRC